jgi:hypothetical protein
VCGLRNGDGEMEISIREANLSVKEATEKGYLDPNMMYSQKYQCSVYLS